MTGKSPRKRVDAFHWQGRLRAARAYLASAQQAMVCARAFPMEEAARLLVDLEAFARWADDVLL